MDRRIRIFRQVPRSNSHLCIVAAIRAKVHSSDEPWPVGHSGDRWLAVIICLTSRMCELTIGVTREILSVR